MTSATVDRMTKILVAQYLAKNDYEEALSNFLKESGLGRSAVDRSQDAFEDLETIVTERIAFNEHQIAAKLAETSLNDDINPIDSKFYLPSWDHTQKLQPVDFPSKPTAMAIDLELSVGSRLCVSTVDKQVYFYSPDLEVAKKLQSTSGVIKKCGVLPHNEALMYYVCGMDGTLTIFDDSFDPKLKHKIHSRIVKHIDFFQLKNSSQYLCFSFGLDNYIKIHLIDLASSSVLLKGSQKLITACTSFQLVQTPTKQPLLFFTRQDHSQLIILALHNGTLVEHCKVALNSAKFSLNSFNIQSLAILNPNDAKKSSHVSQNSHLRLIQEGSMVAVATSHTPYMRLIILEIPDILSFEVGSDCQTQVYYDKVLRNIATVIPQDQFSQSIIKTCHRTGGIIVGSDSGVYAIDVSNCDSWHLIADGQRVKTMNSLEDTLAIAYANSDIEIFRWRQAT
ncbi:LANO_0H20626g1_1 [Lachancea nothofagi CBS 11611]|uniref:LANO_0H20626g1_1 n=1 Tax=Lachancea nothofagi CBS 11611 TaxID=1266666 RepID=A0A1G4KND5_9SACH|nr:LANO_0H20626g1_1 [Lachancea nothofagi CBS 11611]